MSLLLWIKHQYGKIVVEIDKMEIFLKKTTAHNTGAAISPAWSRLGAWSGISELVGND